MGSNVSVISMLFRLIISMGIVLGLMWVLARFMRNRNGMGGVAKRRGSTTAPMEIIARQQLGRNMGVCVVRMGKRAFALGMTEQGVTNLAELDLEDFEIDLNEVQAGPSDLPRTASLGSLRSGSTWKSVLEVMRERTVRR